MMRRLGLLALIAGLSLSAHADNIADCEVVLMELVEGTTAQIASFRDASGFIASVYGGDDILREIDGYPIRGLLCTRSDPVPTERDFALIASRVPFILSTDFDSADGATVQIVADASRRAVAMMAEGLTEAQKDELGTALEAYNAEHAEDVVEDVAEDASEEVEE